jgi:hypothetical protein
MIDRLLAACGLQRIPKRRLSSLAHEQIAGALMMGCGIARSFNGVDSRTVIEEMRRRDREDSGE